ncbi:UNVERIFIED_CONTAM: GNAT family N-acetyltransferase [Streptococcus canis]|uniref:GNAT family N-acetyltransferase n=1 Tax=Streptococcus canis TaxID=1329 RepID=UPI0013DA4D12|nr:GNAT family N-acetyltransferase [Streptococcus canis]QKG78237.1 GNAT family N-acetyltransferase [Streptococcus canis]
MIIKQTRNTLADTYLDAVKIRRQVFIAEQGVPAQLEIDRDEAYCLHFVLYDDKGKPCATCRLLPNPNHKTVTLQRMAVLKSYRGQTLGQQLMTYVLKYAKQQEIERVTLHAQLTAKTFYAKLGFQEEGEIFDEAGIEHITMTQKLA